MKKVLLPALFALVGLGANAQTKTTGVVTLTTGMTAKLDLENGTSTATLTLTGPQDRWLALQFGSFATGGGMMEGTDVVYYNGTTLVDATQNGIGAFPTNDTNDWTVSSNTVSGSTRTIVATRSFAGGTGDYAFVYDNTDIDFAWAKGSSASFNLSNHGGSNRGYRMNQAFTVTAGTDGFALQNLKAYPNPAGNVLNISANDALTGVAVYSLLGQEVLVQKASGNSAVLNTSTLAAGTYLVKVTGENGAADTVKIVKQ